MVHAAISFRCTERGVPVHARPLFHRRKREVREALHKGTGRTETGLDRGNSVLQSTIRTEHDPLAPQVLRTFHRGGTAVLLIPARTDTKWFHEYVYHKAEIRFIKGRVKFGGAKYNAPFPSMIVIYKPTNERRTNP